MNKYIVVTYDNNNPDMPYLSVEVLEFYTPKDVCCTERVATIVNEFKGEKAEELYKKLMGEDT